MKILYAATKQPSKPNEPTVSSAEVVSNAEAVSNERDETAANNAEKRDDAVSELDMEYITALNESGATEKYLLVPLDILHEAVPNITNVRRRRGILAQRGAGVSKSAVNSRQSAVHNADKSAVHNVDKSTVNNGDESAVDNDESTRPKRSLRTRKSADHPVAPAPVSSGTPRTNVKVENSGEMQQVSPKRRSSPNKVTTKRQTCDSSVLFENVQPDFGWNTLSNAFDALKRYLNERTNGKLVLPARTRDAHVAQRVAAFLALLTKVDTEALSRFGDVLPNLHCRLCVERIAHPPHNDEENDPKMVTNEQQTEGDPKIVTNDEGDPKVVTNDDADCSSSSSQSSSNTSRKNKSNRQPEKKAAVTLVGPKPANTKTWKGRRPALDPVGEPFPHLCALFQHMLHAHGRVWLPNEQTGTFDDASSLCVMFVTLGEYVCHVCERVVMPNFIHYRRHSKWCASWNTMTQCELCGVRYLVRCVTYHRNRWCPFSDTNPHAAEIRAALNIGNAHENDGDSANQNDANLQPHATETNEKEAQMTALDDTETHDEQSNAVEKKHDIKSKRKSAIRARENIRRLALRIRQRESESENESASSSCVHTESASESETDDEEEEEEDEEEEQEEDAANNDAEIDAESESASSHKREQGNETKRIRASVGDRERARDRVVLKVHRRIRRALVSFTDAEWTTKRLRFYAVRHRRVVDEQLATVLKIVTNALESEQDSSKRERDFPRSEPNCRRSKQTVPKSSGTNIARPTRTRLCVRRPVCAYIVCRFRSETLHCNVNSACSKRLCTVMITTVLCTHSAARRSACSSGTRPYGAR